MEPKTKWQRVEISTCFCNALNKAHVHCPCIHCEYSAVSSSTEYRHWKEFETYFDHFSSPKTTDNDIDIELANFVDCQSDSHDSVFPDEPVFDDDDNINEEDDDESSFSFQEEVINEDSPRNLEVDKYV